MLWTPTARLGTFAQSAEDPWTAPVNLSRSGAASNPVLVTGPKGTVQVFWWDQFDGMVTAIHDGEEWSSATEAPIVITEVISRGTGLEFITTPLEQMPSITAAGNNAHALWHGEPEERTGIVHLMHSQLTLGTSEWSEPRAIADSVLTWRVAAAPDGAVHLLYVRGQHTEERTAGVYHMKSPDGGMSWDSPQTLYQSPYFRLLDSQGLHLWIVTDTKGEVYAAWDDPRLEKTFLARSLDGGLSWEEPQVVGDAEDGPRRARVIPTRGQPLVLWESSGAATGCALYQKRLAAGGTLTSGASELVLEDLRACPKAMTVHRAEKGNPMVIVDNGTGQQYAAVRDGTQWSAPKLLSLGFEHPELGQQVYLETIQTALVDDELVAVGLGQDGDVWCLRSETEAWEWAFAPPSPWSEPVDISMGEGVPGQPAMVVDSEGQVHVLWGEVAEEGLPDSALFYTAESESRWSRPTAVFEFLEERIEEPVLAAAGDRLHALWSGGWNGTIYHSQAYVQDAYAADGWSEPKALPMAGATGSSPDLLIDAHGTLHVVYTVPLNEGRGVYYVRSDKGAESFEEGSEEAWSEARVIFDAAAAGWLMVDHPTLALDPAGTLHVAWVRGSQDGPFQPQGVFYARSTDGGQTWTEPKMVTDGAYDWPKLVAPLEGQAHLFCKEFTNGSGWTHRWSADYGASWTYKQEVRGFRGVSGPLGLAADGAGTLHLVGLGRDEAGKPALVHATWSADKSWTEHEKLRLETLEDLLPGAAAALASAQGELNVAFRAEIESEESIRQGVFCTGRSVPTVESGPEPAYTPMPTVTPTPQPTPTPTPTPRPTVSAQAPDPAPPALGLGPITLPMTALGGLAAATVLVASTLAGRQLLARRR